MKNFFNLENNQSILKISAFLWLFFALYLFFGTPAGSEGAFYRHVLGVFIFSNSLGLYLASVDPAKHWVSILVGFVVSVFVPVLFINHLSALLFALWILPFYFILTSVYDENTREESSPKKFHDLIKFVRTSQNRTLLELSNEKNVLLVFVRHFGCTFCRETVSEIAKIDEAIKGQNMTVVFVHMSDPTFGDDFFSQYYNHPVHHISDPGRALYQSLNLKRGSLYQIFGPMTLVRGLYAGLFKGHGIGQIEGDALQLGGVFILSHGQIVFEQKANSASQAFEFKTLPQL